MYYVWLLVFLWPVVCLLLAKFNRWEQNSDKALASRPYARSTKEAMQISAARQRTSDALIRKQYEVIPELTVKVRNKRPYAHIRLGPDYKQEDVQWLNEQQALLEIPTLPFVRM